jgi:AcrR family transcriptional regulator
VSSAEPSESGSAPAPKGPGRPRDPEADRAIRQATIELLSEEGYDGLSIESIAARAGVGKTTVYRRWPSKEPLVVDAIKHFKAPMDPAPPRDDESTRDALIRSLGTFTKAVGHSDTGRMMAGLVAEMARNPELARAVRAGILEHRRGLLRSILNRGIERGEIRPDSDIEVVADMLGGAIVTRVLLTGGPVSPQIVRTTVDVALGGISAS